ncbi:DUF6491 family protein [Roseiterribacter gracilis]|uniref:Lipoprotein n=1 Tax=Roseiterribacter gracilis TaxID=2812848 RepID=A0A8S8XAF7_9PROT|nr:hypothetical protein TMPK1_03530 [Rhodospirillales bacterium TMPK1]
MRPAPVSLALLLLAGCAQPAPPPTQPVADARISFFTLSVDDWKAEDSSAVLIRTKDRHYYRATMLGPCPDLPWAGLALGFDTRGGQDLDRFGAVIVKGRRCPFKDFYEIPPVAGW